MHRLEKIKYIKDSVPIIMYVNVCDRNIRDCALLVKIVNIIDHEDFATYDRRRLE